jgi:Flp pilus assembly protein TadD
MIATSSHDDVVALMRAGNWQAAQSRLAELLEADQRDGRALALRGTVCYLTGRHEDAIASFEQALAVASDNVSARLNLGNVYLDKGDLAKARTCFERVAAEDASDPDAHFNLALVADRQGRLREALDHYEHAHQRGAPLEDVSINSATVLLRLSEPQGCLAALAPLIEQTPRHGAARQLEAQALISLGEVDAAEAALDVIAAEHGGEARFMALRGEVRYTAGRIEQAATFLESARSAGDSRRSTAMQLAAALYESGEHAGSARVLEAVVDASPEDGEAWLQLGRALREAGQLERAERAFARAAATQSGAVPAIDALRAGILYSMDQSDEADALLALAMHVGPAEIAPHELWLERCVATGRLDEALHVCDSFLLRRPRDFNMLAARAFLLTARGRAGEATALMDHERLVCTQLLDVPAGFKDRDEFNHALADHLLQHPSLTHAGAASKATQNGRQSGNLFFGHTGPFGPFREAIWSAAQDYLDALPTDQAHPYLSVEPKLTGVHCWGVALEKSGYQSSHIHPTGWLSGVYYPTLPAAIKSGRGAQAGWLEFGVAPPELACEPAPAPVRVRPQEGLLVLFPSYFYHRTVPYDSEEERLSIAFDFQATVA